MKKDITIIYTRKEVKEMLASLFQKSDITDDVLDDIMKYVEDDPYDEVGSSIERMVLQEAKSVLEDNA